MWKFSKKKIIKLLLRETTLYRILESIIVFTDLYKNAQKVLNEIHNINKKVKPGNIIHIIKYI